MGTKILVVDDNMQVRTFLSRSLDEIDGFSVEVAEILPEMLSLEFCHLIHHFKWKLFLPVLLSHDQTSRLFLLVAK